MKSRPHESLACRCRDCRRFDGAEEEEEGSLEPGWWPSDEDLLPDADLITEPAATGEGRK